MLWKVASIYIPSLMDKICPSLSRKLSTTKRFLEGEASEIAKKKINAFNFVLSLIWQPHKHRNRNREETSCEGIVFHA